MKQKSILTWNRSGYWEVTIFQRHLAPWLLSTRRTWIVPKHLAGHFSFLKQKRGLSSQILNILFYTNEVRKKSSSKTVSCALSVNDFMWFDFRKLKYYVRGSITSLKAKCMNNKNRRRLPWCTKKLAASRRLKTTMIKPGAQREVVREVRVIWLVLLTEFN